MSWPALQTVAGTISSPGFQDWDCDEAERCRWLQRGTPIRTSNTAIRRMPQQTYKTQQRPEVPGAVLRAHTHVILVSQIGRRPMQRQQVSGSRKPGDGRRSESRREFVVSARWLSGRRPVAACQNMANTPTLTQLGCCLGKNSTKPSHPHSERRGMARPSRPDCDRIR